MYTLYIGIYFYYSKPRLIKISSYIEISAMKAAHVFYAREKG